MKEEEAKVLAFRITSHIWRIIEAIQVWLRGGRRRLFPEPKERFEDELTSSLKKKFGDTAFTRNLTRALVRQALFQQVLVGCYKASVTIVMKRYAELFDDAGLGLQAAAALEVAGVTHPDVDMNIALLRKLIRLIEPRVDPGPIRHRSQVIAAAVFEAVQVIANALKRIQGDVREFYESDPGHLYKVYKVSARAPGEPAFACAELVYWCRERRVRVESLQPFINYRPEYVRVFVHLLQSGVLNAQAIAEFSSCPDLLKQRSPDQLTKDLRAWRDQDEPPLKEFIERSRCALTPTP